HLLAQLIYKLVFVVFSIGHGWCIICDPRNEFIFWGNNICYLQFHYFFKGNDESVKSLFGLSQLGFKSVITIWREMLIDKITANISNHMEIHISNATNNWVIHLIYHILVQMLGLLTHEQTQSGHEMVAYIEVQG
ncbi:hypothetical protein ACJX0J_006429, partial [Zea mays]